MNKNQDFIEKFYRVVFILILIKIITIVVQFFFNDFKTSLENVFILIFVVFVLILLLAILKIFNNEKKFSTNNYKNSGNFYLEDSLFNKIRKKYEDLAENYIKQKKYLDASKVYINLLKDNYRGVKTIVDGGYYNEAAIFYLKKLDNKYAAAECYEKAKQYKKAIDLYKTYKLYEKIGDLYLLLNDEKNALNYFQLQIDNLLIEKKIIKAALIYSKKMNNLYKAQEILLKGWQDEIDAFNCLNNYFANIKDISVLEAQILYLYKNTKLHRLKMFLTVLKTEFKKNLKLQPLIRNIAYEIVSKIAEKDKKIASQLLYFTPEDKIIIKDISRFISQK